MSSPCDKMKRSKLGILLMIIAILVSYGESSTSAIHGCNNPNIFVSYLDLNRYNNTNNFMDFNNVVVPMVDHITEGKPFSENIHDLVTIWIEVCKADDPEKENAAWKELAKEIHHRLHSDESVAQIARVIFGDRLVPWIMDPPHSLVVTNSRVEDCIFRLSGIFMEHCGVWNSFGLKYYGSFYAMCSLGAGDDEFTEVAKETCRGYVYIPHPLLT